MSRQASDKERAKDLPTYKDNDFLNDRVIIHIAPEPKHDILEMLQGDVNVSTTHQMWFLCSLSVYPSQH